MIVPGKPNQPVKPAKVDPYLARCAALAEELHFEPDEVFDFFMQIWMAHALEQRWPRSVAKWQALRDVRFALDRRGRSPD